MSETQSDYDAIIIGGGPAGLSAAVVLGRCRRRVLLCDNGRQRNLSSHAMHGYLTRDCISPAEFLHISCEEARKYGVEIRNITVRNASPHGKLFRVELDDGSHRTARKLLLATGVADHVPEIDGIQPLYGISVHHCPYCDGWENRDQAIAVYSKTAGLALSLTTWSADVILFTDGEAPLSRGDRQKLKRHNIPVYMEKITRVEGRDGHLRRIVLEDGRSIERHAMFFSTGQHQACDLATGIGCFLNDRGTVDTNKLEMSNVPGVYVAGDASKDVQLVIVAAAEGAKAAFAINVALQREEL